jgi:pyruvate/2-oxoglutarate dehydrogenase complex dihydrolipoamide dehydrogenase (E3) component
VKTWQPTGLDSRRNRGLATTSSATWANADVIVIGATPAGVVAALRAAELGAQTVLLARDAFGGMTANDGPVPVRTLDHAARLIREARQLGKYGITVSEPC